MMGTKIGGAGEMESELSFLMKAVETINEIDSNPKNRHVAEQRIIEHIKIDFAAMEERLISVVRLVNNGRATRDDYRGAFYKLWSEKAPALFVKILNDNTKKRMEGAVKFRDLIFEMGDKVYALLDGDSKICVSIDIPPIPCDKCYFTSICKLAVKK